jgi:GNAT superfamily N-acetyltransferase
MPRYHVRLATLDDLDALVRHRIGMFTDMGVAMDVGEVDRAFRAWLADMMPAGVYHGWVVVADDREIVAGGAITILPWPPGPQSLLGRVAFAYNVYTEPAHRGFGLARTVMGEVHAWCRKNGVKTIMLNASAAGQPLYESLGYEVTRSPMMSTTLD